MSSDPLQFLRSIEQIADAGRVDTVHPSRVKSDQTAAWLLSKINIVDTLDVHFDVIVAIRAM
jgi:hypothetical protein